MINHRANKAAIVVKTTYDRPVFTPHLWIRFPSMVWCINFWLPWTLLWYSTPFWEAQRNGVVYNIRSGRLSQSPRGAASLRARNPV
eukprot:6642787-Heterocapsa_arctica.AAC.1